MTLEYYDIGMARAGMPATGGLFAFLVRPRNPMSLVRALALVVLAALVGAPAALAQTGQQKYVTWCQGCHGNPVNNKDNVLGGKDWNIIKTAMDTKPTMTADLRPAYNSGLLTDDDFMLIAGYLQTFGGGVTSQLSMPTAANFGTVTVGVGSSVVAKTVSSIGNAAVQLTSVTSSNALEFAIVGGTCTARAFVNPLSSCTVNIQFTPAATGTRSGQITIVSNGIGSPQSFAVSGTGQAAGSGTPALTMPSAHNFGTVSVGSSSSVAAKTITSSGTAAAQITTVTSSNPGEFPIVSRTCTDGATVNVGATCTVSVQFAPAASGSRNGTITVTSNGTGSPQSFSVSGTGQTVAGSPSLSVPGSANLGSSPVGVQTAGTQVTISNTGTASATITSVLSSSVSEFPIVGNTCGIVAAGANCKVTVAFKPLASGARSGSLTITSNAPGSPHSVALSGTGTGGTQTGTKVTVVEYYNSALNHYFTTASAGEISALDAKLFPGWDRTGYTFNAWSNAVSGTNPVCRFYLPPGYGDSHFYSALPSECTAVQVQQPAFVLESSTEFYIPVPDLATGNCPAGTIPVYRLWNHRPDTNHRFTTDLGVRAQMIALGYVPEGAGIGVTMCSPL